MNERTIAIAILAVIIVAGALLWLVRAQQCAAVGRVYNPQIFACVEATRPWDRP